MILLIIPHEYFPSVFLFYEAAPVKPGKKCGNCASVTYEIKNRLPDKDGNPYPSRDKCYIVVSKTANSNKDYTKLILKKVILPEMGVSSDGTCDHIIGFL